MKYVILAFVLLCSMRVTAAQRLFPFADTSGLSINESLQNILSGELGGEQSAYLILRAGYHGGASDRPALRQFVRAYQEGRDEYSGYAKLALESLWELGESHQYFLNLVRQWDQGAGSPWPDEDRRVQDRYFWTAFYAARILVREPDQNILAVLDSVRIETNSDGYLGVSVFLARNMAADLERYEQTESVAERIAWAMKWASYGGGPLAGNHFSTNSFLHPKGGVGRHWLEELAQMYPQQVAQAIRGLDIEGEEGYEFEEEEWYSRRHLAAFTNNEVRALLADCISDEAIYLGCRP